jgi:hypothetical protein
MKPVVSAASHNPIMSESNLLNGLGDRHLVIPMPRTGFLSEGFCGAGIGYRLCMTKRIRRLHHVERKDPLLSTQPTDPSQGLSEHLIARVRSLPCDKHCGECILPFHVYSSTPVFFSPVLKHPSLRAGTQTSFSHPNQSCYQSVQSDVSPNIGQN